jgi:soluble lytic murein transglycosylase-like protein
VLFANENNYDWLVDEAAAAWDVEAALIKAVIGAESEFHPDAHRAEPAINDASYGLMQMLYGTARTLGYTGAASGLFDPTTNIRLGTRYLRDLIRTAANRGYSIESAISAYNAGFSTVRPGDGKRTTNAPGAPFINQTYVDRVIGYANYFAHHTVQQLETVTVVGSTTPDIPGWLFPFVGAGLFLLFASVSTKRNR